MRDSEATEAIRGLAERQHGIVSRRQLLELGVGLGAIQRRREGGGAVLSHGSAAQLWGFRGSRGPIEVTRRSGGARHPGVRLHQTRLLEPAEVTEEAGIPVTSIERAILDMAARLDDRQLERALVAADRSGRLSGPRWRACSSAAAAAGARAGSSESPAKSIRRRSKPAPVRRLISWRSAVRRGCRRPP